MIEPRHKTLSDLASIPASENLRAGRFASCVVLEPKLDRLFEGELAPWFHALPLERKQVICAVLSGADIEIGGLNATLRRNLSTCSPRYLLNLRFKSHVTEIERVLNSLEPKCLPDSQYDPLHAIIARNGLDPEHYSANGKIDTSALSEWLPEDMGDLDDRVAAFSE